MIGEPGLMRALEATLAACSVETVDAFRLVDPAHPARATRVGSGALVGWGPGRFVNRAVGISLDSPDGDTLDELETFFDAAGVPPSIEVHSWADPALVARVANRQFRPVRFNDVLVAKVPEDASASTTSAVVGPASDLPHRVWQRLFVDAFGAPTPEFERVTNELTDAIVHVPRSVHLVAEVDGVPAGCGSLYPQGRIGWIGGAATLPAYRRRGVQRSLIDARLAAANAAGCDVVAATAVSGSDSSRNMQRIGFRLVATIVMMTRDQ